MSAPYLRFMNGDMSLWDFVGEMDNQQRGQPYSEQGRRGHPGYPGPSNAWAGFNNGSQEAGAFAHGFTHRPHPRHRGRHGPPGWHRPPFHPHHTSPADQSDAPSETLPGSEPPQYEAMNNDDNDAIHMEDKEKNNEKTNHDDDFSDPEISTPRDTENNENEESDSGNDDQTRRHGSRRGRRGEWGGHGRGGRWHGPHGHNHHHHPYGFGGSWGHGPAPWGHGGFGSGRRRGGGRGGCPFAFDRHGGPGRAPHGGPPGFPDLMRAFATENFSRLPENVREMLAQFHVAATGARPDNRDAQETGVAADAERNEGQTTHDNDDDDKTVRNGGSSDIDFRPAADIYDAPEAYIVHLVLPGAKKEDVSLSWDADRCELQVAGVIARDGDETTLQALALAERDVGVFERRVKLGTDKIDHEAISARMDNGILIVTVPKKKEDDTWTEVREIDIL